MKLSIIILNHNTKKLLSDALSTIKCSYPYEIIVVDNASTDGSVSYLKKHFPKIKLIESSENLGFAAGNNLGILQNQAEYCMLLNSDTLVGQKALDLLIDYMEVRPDVGIITPKLVLENGDIDWGCHRGFPTVANALGYFLGLDKFVPWLSQISGYHLLSKNLNTIHEVDVVSGASMLIRKQVIDKIGFLDEDYFMYAEDIDYCFRAKKAGFGVVYFPHAQITHLKGRSGTKSSDEKIRIKTRGYFYQSMKQYYQKHHSVNYPKLINRTVEYGIDLLAKLRG